MENKKLYRFRNNILFLLLISVVVSLTSFFYYSRNIKNRSYSHSIDMLQQQTILSSLNDYNVENTFPYYVKSFKTKYYTEDGVKLSDKDGKRMYEAYVKQEELRAKGLDPLAYSQEVAKKVIKKNEVFFINKKNLEIEPDDVKFDDNDFLIRGVATDGNVVIEEVKTSKRMENSPFLDAINNGFTKHAKNLIHQVVVESQIKNLKFCYTVNLDSDIFLQAKTESFYRDVMIPIVITSFLVNVIVVAIYSLFINYKKWQRENGVPTLFRLPIELVVILFFFYVVLGIIILDNFNVFIRNLPETMVNISYVVFVLGIFTGNFIAGLSIFYLIIGGKSLIQERKDGFLIQNSILYRIVHSILEGLSHTVGEAETEHTVQKAKSRVLMIEIGLFLLSIIYFLVFQIRNPFLSVMIFIILLVISYQFMIRLIDEIATINRSSSEIAKGHYHVRVDNSYPMYKKIADNFNNIGENLNKAVDEAVKSERMKSELVTNVSHDLKTPLTSIINYSDLIDNPELSQKEREEYAKIINEKSQKLKQLIEDLFEISKVTSRNIVLDLEEIDFKSLLMQVMGEWEDKLEEKSIDIVSNIGDSPIILNLDGSKTSRILDNIFSNIDKYAMEGSRVYVDLQQKESLKILEIKNMSKYPLNISADELKERFIRGDISRTTEGAGLGLSIAESLVEAQGGTFDIQIDGDLFKTIITF